MQRRRWKTSGFDAERPASSGFRGFQVHIRTISAQLEGAAEAESKGLGVRRGLSDYEKQYEIQSERRSELNNLEARLHDLRALKEEVALQHHLNQQERDQVMEYLERDMKRCDEEIEIMRPASALSSLPDELIQVGQRDFYSRISLPWGAF